MVLPSPSLFQSGDAATSSAANGVSGEPATRDTEVAVL